MEIDRETKLFAVSQYVNLVFPPIDYAVFKALDVLYTR